MAGLLREYRQKRNFRKTPEPGARVEKAKAKKLVYVVQEHHASHLHYDFRLEWEGVLKSWAVPKGPSKDPSVKRLAVHVEDHPIPYAKFHGVIPENQYGAGTVKIWDSGSWEPEGDVDAMLKKGHLSFVIKGKKLKGRWTLLRTSRLSGRKEQWLLMKRADERPHRSEITHPEKILFPEDGVTKGDVADYYAAVSEWMWPYLEGRPVSLFRCPSGVHRSCFFQKHLEGEPAPGLAAVPIAEKAGTRDDVVAETTEALRSFAQMGALELHVWNAKADLVEKPDQIVMDFDPDPDLPWKAVVNAALSLKEILDGLDLKSFVKLTGGKGLHIHIPLEPVYDWETVLSFAHTLATEMRSRDPKLFLDKASKSSRKGKIFVDYLRNSRGATAVVPYSLRAKERTAVAMPVEWKDLLKYKASNFFTLEKALKHVKERKSDPWKGYGKSRQRVALLERKH